MTPQEQATLDAVVAQRNEESNKVAQVTGQLVVSLQDVEGLNMLIAEQAVSLQELKTEIAEKTLALRAVEGLNKIIADQAAEIDRLDATSIESGKEEIGNLKVEIHGLRNLSQRRGEAIDELKDKLESKYNDLEEDRDNKHHEVIRLNNVIRTNIINHTKSQLHNEEVIREQRATIAGKDHTITRIQVDLKKANCFANGDPKAT